MLNFKDNANLLGITQYPLQASLVAQKIKNLPAIQETQVWSLGQEDPLEQDMETHSSILAWRIPWTGSLVGYGIKVAKSETRLSNLACTCRQGRGDTHSKESVAKDKQFKIRSLFRSRLVLSNQSKSGERRREGWWGAQDISPELSWHLGGQRRPPSHNCTGYNTR